MLIITLMSLIYYLENVEISIYGVKMTAFAQIIVNLFSNCH